MWGMGSFAWLVSKENQNIEPWAQWFFFYISYIIIYVFLYKFRYWIQTTIFLVFYFLFLQRMIIINLWSLHWVLLSGYILYWNYFLPCSCHSARHWTQGITYARQSTACCSFSGQIVEPCGYIYPEFPVVQRGSNFTAICVLKEKCLQQYYVNASFIVWKTNHVAVPKEQVTVINRTTSSVTFTDMNFQTVQLTCNILSFGQIEQNVYGTTVLSGCKILVLFPSCQIHL